MIDKNLLDKFYRGECTDAEVRQVLRAFKERKEGEKRIETLWNDQLTEESPSVLGSGKRLAAIWRRTGPLPQQLPVLQMQWIKVAAIIILAALLSVILVRNEFDATLTPPPALTLTKENPAGRKSVIHLPDGSVVHLNAESRITYRKDFGGSFRRISLVGEAFFEVAKDTARPFIVSSAGVDTQALGTAFNVKAYEEDGRVQVVLASGQVQVAMHQEKGRQEVYLSPGEEVQVETHTQTVVKQLADLRSTLSWKDNIIIFDQSPAPEVFAELERWYGVTFTFAQKFSDDSWRFTGEFQNESLENVLESISYIKNFRFQIRQKTVFITP